MNSLFIDESRIKLLGFFSGRIFGIFVRIHIPTTCPFWTFAVVSRFGMEDEPVYPFFVGSLLRLVFAKSLSCFSDIDSAIFFDAPLRLDLSRSPRVAANAAPAAICCFFDFAGILLNRPLGE